MMKLDAWLTVLQSATPPRSQRVSALIDRHASVAEVVDLPRSELAAAGLSRRQAERLKNPDRQRMDQWRAWLDRPGRGLITRDSTDYPAMLKELPDPPLALWVEGTRSDLLNGPQLAMVGSRKPTANGRETAQRFARYLSERGLTIVSGLATGIDGASHRGALLGCGGTLAVLGSGPDVLFPRSHARLAAEIIAKGLIVSEYPPGTPPLAAHFPQRNRIIAGMSAGTLVVEAARRSGSLITARLAGNYGREVFAIPGSIHNPMAKGCHRLIRDGAKLVEEAADVLVELPPLLELSMQPAAPPAGGAAEAPEETAPLEGQPGYAELLAALGFDPCGISNLARRTGLTAAELSSMLLLLEMEGLVEALPGGRYCRLSKRTP
ncbi:MAG: DNA-processing protein DprA [Rhodospirillaceae bacterium]|nr:DNA-processing protein DprA [Rhodospirillaceae bacterium]